MVKGKPRRGRVVSAKKTPEPRPERPTEPFLESEESELPELPEEWDGGVSRRTISFYHAEGAPYLDDDGRVHGQPPSAEMEELRRQGLVIPPTIVDEIVGSVVPIPIREAKKPSAAVPVRAVGSPPGRTRTVPEERPQAESDPESMSVQELPAARLKKPLDLSMVEEVAYLAIKRVFGEGVRIPIRREGLADLDVTIKDKEIVIDVNRLIADVPMLSVWRVTFAYQGEPLVLYGRGVKGDLKVNRLRMARFLTRAWLEKRKRQRKTRRETTG